MRYERREHSEISSGSARIRLRAILVAGVVLPIKIFAVVRGNWIIGKGSLAQSMVAQAVAIIFLLALLNAALARSRPRWRFTRAELIAIYSVVAISTGGYATPWDWGGSIAGIAAWPLHPAALLSASI